jgi:hypothetical protein
MATQDAQVRAAIALMGQPTGSNEALYLVQTTMLKALLRCMSPRQLKRATELLLRVVPDVESARFSEWIEAAWSLSELSQEAFAAKVGELGKVPVFGSDISTLINRLDEARISRRKRERIRDGIQLLNESLVRQSADT